MQIVKFLCFGAIVFASCRTARQNIALPAGGAAPVIAGAVSPNTENTLQQEPFLKDVQTDKEHSSINNSDGILAVARPALKATTKKANSFAEMKAMARTGEITMSKKDLKTLNKLDKKYNGNFQKFRSDAFEFTNKAKIIAGIGLLGLLPGIFLGSGFGWFLFILAALAFILRYLDVIAF